MVKTQLRTLMHFGEIVTAYTKLYLDKDNTWQNVQIFAAIYYLV